MIHEVSILIDHKFVKQLKIDSDNTLNYCIDQFSQSLQKHLKSLTFNNITSFKNIADYRNFNRNNLKGFNNYMSILVYKLLSNISNTGISTIIVRSQDFIKTIVIDVTHIVPIHSFS